VAKKEKVVIESKKVSLRQLAKDAGGLIRWVGEDNPIRAVVVDESQAYQRPGYKDTPSFFVAAVDPDTHTPFWMKLTQGAVTKVGMVSSPDVVLEVAQVKNAKGQVRYKVDVIEKITDVTRLAQLQDAYRKGDWSEAKLDEAIKNIGGSEE